MIIERFVKPNTYIYKSLRRIFNSFLFIEKYDLITWFAPWTVMAAAMASRAGYSNRYTFWDFSNWISGSIYIIILILTLVILKKKKHGIVIEYERKNEISGWITIFFLFFISWMLGWGLSYIHIGILMFISYLPLFMGIYILYFIEKSNDKKNIPRKKIGVISCLMLLLACIFGWIVDDPVLATASIVSTPFTIVMALTSHPRHIQRAQIFPLFGLIGFVISRQGLFIFPILILFYLLRFYNYFVYKKVIPTFAVDQ